MSPLLSHKPDISTHAHFDCKQKGRHASHRKLIFFTLFSLLVQIQDIFFSGFSLLFFQFSLFHSFLLLLILFFFFVVVVVVIFLRLHRL